MVIKNSKAVFTPEFSVPFFFIAAFGLLLAKFFGGTLWEAVNPALSSLVYLSLLTRICLELQALYLLPPS